ncbi:hypothetical protein N5J70_04190 [Pseudomonas sp. GD03909]|nr:hypothetical protein [Pseudomonas sp. GD03909]
MSNTEGGVNFERACGLKLNSGLNRFQEIAIFLYAFLGVVAGASWGGGQPFKLLAQGGILCVLLMLGFFSNVRVFLVWGLVSLGPAIFFYLSGFSAWVLHCYALLLLACAVIVCAEKNVEFLKRVSSFCFYGSMMGFSTIVGLASFGFIENHEFYVSTSGALKSSLGFFNPNVAGLYVAGILISAFLAGGRVKIFISLLISALVVFMSVPRGAIVLVVIFFLAYYIATKLSLAAARIVFLFGVAIFLFLFFTFLAFFSSYENLPSSLEGIDILLSRRIVVALNALAGRVFWFPGEIEVNLDFAWANLVRGVGLFGGLVFGVFLFFGFYRINCHNFRFVIAGGALGIASLFVENVAYVYFSFGIFLFLPIAVAFLFWVSVLFRLVRLP